MLIFDENKQYQNLIENGFEKYPNKRDLIILCNHWINEDGCEMSDLRNNIVKFCTKWNNQFNEAKSENLILKVLDAVEKQQNGLVPFVYNKEIIFTNNEAQTIIELKDKKLQKIAFVILCLAKWRNANYIYVNSESSIKLKDIFDFAQVKATGKEKATMLHILNEMGFIDVQLKPILKLFIPCIQNDIQDDSVLKKFTISDDMINEWLDIVCPHCERCGKFFEKTGNNNKFCAECSREVRREQDRLRKRLQKFHILK